MNDCFKEVLQHTEKQAQTLVWWSPSQIERREHVDPDPAKGNRPWSVPRSTGEFLYETVSTRKPNTVLELGTSIGYSALWIAKALSEYGGTLHTIERMPEKCVIAAQNISDAGLNEHVRIHCSEIPIILNDLENILNGSKLDMVFMDADRGHYHEYFPLIKNHLSGEAMIIADNAENMGKRMQPFLDLLQSEGWGYEILNKDNGLLIATYQAANHNS